MNRWASAGFCVRTFVTLASDMVHGCHPRSAVTASQTPTPSVDLARRGAAQSAEGRHCLAPQPAALFRGSRDDRGDAEGQKRRKAILV